MPSPGKRCKRFSRGRRPLLLGIFTLFAISEFLWVGQCLSYLNLQQVLISDMSLAGIGDTEMGKIMTLIEHLL